MCAVEVPVGFSAVVFSAVLGERLARGPADFVDEADDTPADVRGGGSRFERSPRSAAFSGGVCGARSVVWFRPIGGHSV